MTPASARLKGVAKRARSVALRQVKGRAFYDFLGRLPESLVPAARLIFYSDFSEDERRMSRLIEGFRTEIADSDEAAMSFGSPHSGAFSLDHAGRAAPGPTNAVALATHAETGVPPQGGVLLRRLVEGLGAESIVELGTNTGFSGGYVLSAANAPKLVTIEGSADLCKIAQANLRRVTDESRYRVMNCLFDEAIDQLLGEDGRFACAFIDGQHEQEATLHYADRVAELLAPNGAIIFDDIYWSEDMNEAWVTARDSGRFAQTFDMASKGLCVLGEGAPVHYDICEFVGRPGIYRKNW